MVKPDDLGALAKGGTAQTLLIEDELKKIIQGKQENTKRIQDAKRRGFMPRGGHSCFGDFPAHYLRSVSSPRLQRGGSDEAITGDRLRSTWGDMSQSRYLSSGGGPRRRRTPMEAPPRAGATRRRKIESSAFREHYDRGNLPIHVHHAGIGNRAAWSVTMESLNFSYYLPIFLDGMREKEDPYRFLAIQGAIDMLECGANDKILPVIPQMVVPIKAAFNTRDREVMCVVLKIIKSLVMCVEGAADALVPYFRQILPVLNIFRNSNTNIGDCIEYDQRKNNNLGDLIQETLEKVELHASPGAQAFINIKYMIPTYESALFAPARGEGLL